MIPGKVDGRLAWSWCPKKATLSWMLATPLWRTDPPFPLGARLHPPCQSLLTVGAMLGRTVCRSPGNSRCPSPWAQQPTQSFRGQGYMDSLRGRCCIHVVETAGLGLHDRALGGSSATGATLRDRAEPDNTPGAGSWALRLPPFTRCQIAAEPWVSCTWGCGDETIQHRKAAVTSQPALATSGRARGASGAGTCCFSSWAVVTCTAPQ